MIASWILLTAIAVLLLLSIWIIVPAPNMALIPLGVGAPELSPLLLIAALILGALTLAASRGAVKRAAAYLAVTNILICAVPLTRCALAVPRFDDAIRTVARGHNPGDRMRPRLLVLRELVRGIDTGSSRVVRGIEFATPQDHPLALTVYRPTSAGRFPILVQIYGGAWQRGAPDENAAFAQYFASRGHVVFAIDYRHAPQWQWPAQIDDVRAALSWIRAHAAEYDGDVTRTALVGRSAGAQLALVAAYQEGAATVAAVVSYYGPTDLVEGWREPPRPDPLGTRSVLAAYLGGTPDQKPEAYRAASPITYVSSKAPPTLLVYGARDHIVEAKFGRQLHARLREAGATSVLIQIPWSEHAFDALPGGLAGQVSLYYTERFLAATLAPRPR